MNMKEMQPGDAHAAMNQQDNGGSSAMMEPSAGAGGRMTDQQSGDQINPMAGAGQDLPPEAAADIQSQTNQEMSLGQSGGETPRPERSQQAGGGQGSSVARRDDFLPSFLRGGTSPFTMMRRVAEEMDQMLDRAGFGPGWLAEFNDRRFFPDLFGGRGSMMNWRPQIEVFRRGDELVVHADLPGMSREDVNVQFVDGELVIEGERRERNEDRREGYYHSERSYGRFVRRIPLPRGADPDNARATFRDGVLEVTLHAPEQGTQGRSIQID